MSVVEVRVPDIGDAKGVNVVDVLVKKGSEIRIDDPLITLETEKASMDVPSPVSGTVNSTCEPADSEIAGRVLKWHLLCKGQLDIDVLASFNFDSPSHYTATVSSKGRMAGQLISDVKTEIEGERVGECQQ